MQHRHLGARYDIGDTIQGRWRIRSIVGGPGRSGMGIVYIADDLDEKRLVAIKTFQADFARDERVRSLLWREANLWLSMGRHPNIVSLETVEQYGTQVFIFMEYVRPDAIGRNTLSAFMEGTPLAPARIVDSALQICDALIHMRACGIDAHADLKPDNVMVTAEGAVKVTDFGLAQAGFGNAGREARGAGSLESPGPILGGTPGFMAPELVLGGQPDVRSDIFAVGLILVQMITGRAETPLAAPLQRDRNRWERETLELRRQEAPPTERSILHGVVSRCLSFDPAGRYLHFVELGEALRTIGAQSGIVPSATTAAVQGGKPALSGQDAVASDDGSISDDRLMSIHGLIQLGRLSEALERIRELKIEAPFHTTLLSLEGTALADLGQTDRAIEVLRFVCENQPEKSAHWNSLGRAFRAAGDLEAALESFGKALELDPKRSAIWVNKAICLLNLTRAEEALAGFNHALSRDPFNVFALLGRAEALLHLDQKIAALAAFEEVLDVDPANADAARRFNSGLDSLRAQPARQSITDGIRLAKGCYTRAEHLSALDGIREARFRHGDRAELLQEEGRLLIGLGEVQAALRVLDRGLQQDPDCSGLLTMKGFALCRLGRPEEALVLHDRAIERAPSSWLPQVHKCLCLAELYRKEEALAAYWRGYKLALRQGDPEACAATAPDAEAICNATALLATFKFADAASQARRVTPTSVFYADAMHIAARATLGLSRARLDSGLTDAKDALDVLTMLHRALLELEPGEEKAEAADRLVAAMSTCFHEFFEGFVENDNLDAAETLLRLSMAHDSDIGRADWVRQQLAIVLANRAIRSVEKNSASKPAAGVLLAEAARLFGTAEAITDLAHQLLGNHPYPWCVPALPSANSWIRLASEFAAPRDWMALWRDFDLKLKSVIGALEDRRDAKPLEKIRAGVGWLLRTDPADAGARDVDLRQACRLAACFGQKTLRTSSSGNYTLPVASDIEPMLGAVAFCCELVERDRCDLPPAAYLAAQVRDRCPALLHHTEERAPLSVQHGNVAFDILCEDVLPTQAQAPELLLAPTSVPLRAAGLMAPEFYSLTDATSAPDQAICSARVLWDGLIVWMSAATLAALDGRTIWPLSLHRNGEVETIHIAL